MNSKSLKSAAIIFALCSGASATSIEHKQAHKMRLHSEGIFGRMIDQVTAPQRMDEERHKATQRKQEQLAEAQKTYEDEVKQEEQEELLQKKKLDDEAEAAAIEAAKNSPQAKMFSAANDAASSINMAEMEANIQANLEAKINAGASKAEILAGAADDLSIPMPSIPVAQSVVSQVLAQHHIAHKKPSSVSLQSLAPISPPVMAATQISSTADVAISSSASAETKASQEKVKEMAHKLGIPFTADLVALGTNAAISNALIEKAVSAGKTEAQIDAAMSTL